MLKIFERGFLAGLFMVSFMVAGRATGQEPAEQQPAVEMNAMRAPSGGEPGPSTAGGQLVRVTVSDVDGQETPGAQVILILVNANGDLLWKGPLSEMKSANQQRFFTISADQLPVLTGTTAGVIAADAKWRLSDSVGVSVDGSDPLSIQPRDIQLRMTPIDPWLTAIILLPAVLLFLFGAVNASLDERLLFLSGAANADLDERQAATPIGAGSTRLWRWISPVYKRAVAAWRSSASSALAAIFWGAVVVLLVWRFVKTGDHLIVLFWPDVVVSSGIVVFSYLGTLVYVCWSCYQRTPDFFADTQEGTRARAKFRRTIGGRILVAPYVALTAFAILATTFPAFRSGAPALFFAFFTGLWIKIVLNFLNDLGVRLLAAAAPEVAAKLTSKEGEKRPLTTEAGTARPTRAFRESIQRAASELARRKEVIGVEPRARSDGEFELIAYVSGDGSEVAHPLPSSVAGLRLRASRFRGPDATRVCDGRMQFLLWSKLHREHQKVVGQGVAALPPVEVEGQLLVLPVPDADVLYSKSTDPSEAYSLFMPGSAYELLRPARNLGDDYDFVSFFLDLDSGLMLQTDYFVPVSNDVDGINYFWGPEHLAWQPNWGTTRLRGFQVYGKGTVTHYSLLHEIGHAWSAYVTFADPANGSQHRADLLDDGDGKLQHWSKIFDSGCSCMDYYKQEWTEVAPGRYRVESIQDDLQFGYSKLDLYLMGLLRAEEVGAIQLFRNPRLVAGSQNEYTAEVETLHINDVIRSVGKRLPPYGSSPVAFRQLMVVVTQDPASGRQHAQKIDSLRERHEQRFSEATLQRASLETRLA